MFVTRANDKVLQLVHKLKIAADREFGTDKEFEYDELVDRLAALGEKAIPALLQQLAKFRDDDFGGSIALVLGFMEKAGEPAVPNLLEVLVATTNTEVRISILSALGRIGEHADTLTKDNIAQALVTLLKDNTVSSSGIERVSMIAAESLGELGERGFTAITNALCSEKITRVEADYAMKQIQECMRKTGMQTGVVRTPRPVDLKQAIRPASTRFHARIAA